MESPTLSAGKPQDMLTKVANLVGVMDSFFGGIWVVGAEICVEVALHGWFVSRAEKWSAGCTPYLKTFASKFLHRF